MDNDRILTNLLEKKQLEPYIRYIRFPTYKNFQDNTRIDFTYPITALVGANGTNKSSVLRALYGCPKNLNLGDLWFSTHIDPIQETGDRRNCFIYGYFNDNANDIVEVLNTRIKDEVDPDLWETSRPVAKYGMKPMPALTKNDPIPSGRSKTRWEAIDKKVVYIDFRASLSAYDKFFYHGELKGKTNSLKVKKLFIRTRSPHLKEAIRKSSKYFPYRKSERIINEENRLLSKEETAKISNILGKEYTEITLIRHSFYNIDGYTCLMKTATDLQYSEAFAGSGEFAVVKMVTDIMSANKNSLILLDEPEVSLHPGAQEKLILFIRDQVKENKHQVVISTHSPTIVRQLPTEAVKCLRFDNISKRVVLINQSCSHDEAFFYIGERASDSTTIIVEDLLAKEITEYAIKTLGEPIFKTINVIFFPGGADTLWKYYIPSYTAEQRKDVFVLLDGDKNKKHPVPDVHDLRGLNHLELADEIKKITGVKIDFQVDGHNGQGDLKQKERLQKQFLSWIKEHVSYLPGDKTPEHFILENMTNKKALSETNDPKIYFEEIARSELGKEPFEEVRSSEIITIQKLKLATISKTHSDIVALARTIQEFRRVSLAK